MPRNYEVNADNPALLEWVRLVGQYGDEMPEDVLVGIDAKVRDLISFDRDYLDRGRREEHVRVERIIRPKDMARITDYAVEYRSTKGGEMHLDRIALFLQIYTVFAGDLI